MKKIGIILLVLFVIPTAFAVQGGMAQDANPPSAEPSLAVPLTPAPIVALRLPDNMRAADIPNDAGRAIDIEWDKPDPKTDLILAAASLVFWRKGGADADWLRLGEGDASSGKYTDAYLPESESKAEHRVDDGVAYQYKVSLADAPQIESATMTATASGQWINTNRLVILGAMMIYVGLVIFFIQLAKRGRPMYVRPIPGITAIEDAVGRATEMGKPVLYIPGLGAIEEIATLAAMTILGPIAEKTAEYDTALLVPNRDPIVYSIAQEVVRQAYLKMGRPDSYKEDNIFFLSGRQFAYAAGVAGIMMREKPATVFYFGTFYAESLILAETGAATGSVQIAGTDQVTQLPFFIAACDYTLLGEELYAASAYLSKQPILVGSLKALDYAKLIIFALMGFGLAAGLSGWKWFAEFFATT